MASMTENWFALWSWPLNATRLANDIMETNLATQRVIAARLPTIGAAMQNPFTADTRELSRMVTEKVTAFGASGRSVEKAGASVRRAAAANAKAMGSIAGGGLFWPDQWLRLAEDNLAAFAAMAALPAAALAPLHKGVTANDKRLGRR